MEKREYIIIPGCTDLNRGDQALVWETAKIIRLVDRHSEIYMTTIPNNNNSQSMENGIKTIPTILDHPSSRVSIKENIDYRLNLKIIWGVIALIDLMRSILLLNSVTRKFGELLFSKEKRKTIQLFKKADAFFVKGGGFIHTFGGITAFYYMYYSLFHIMLAVSLKKKVIIMPNSFGPFIGIGVKRMVKITLSKCILIFSRESVSQKYLNEALGINVKCYPDLAFLLSKNCIDNSEIKDIFNYLENKKLVAITVRPYRFPEYSNADELYSSYIISMRKMLKWLYNNNYMPVIVEHTLSKTTHESDISCITEIIQGLDENHYFLISNKSFNCKDLKAIYANCSYVIGTRFHSVIFSLAEGIPSIAITYGGNKGVGIMKDINLYQYCIPINEISFDMLKEKFIDLVNNSNKVESTLHDYKAYVKNQHREIIKIIHEALL